MKSVSKYGMNWTETLVLNDPRALPGIAIVHHSNGAGVYFKVEVLDHDAQQHDWAYPERIRPDCCN